MTRPNIQIPKEFAINGEKVDFTQEKIQTGFDKLNPDIFAGDNLNKFIDDTYKGLNGVLDLYNGVVLHDMATTYDDKSVVGKFIENSFKLYRSLVNDNTGHEVTETEYWEEVALGGGSGFNLFDTKISDHVLEGNEALGWALQGTYVYKEGVAGSRIGYADFYNKCLAEKENSTATETTLGDNTITMYVNGNGHKFYDIADKDVVDTFYNAIGTAWFYGIDTENERVFLPRNDHFVQLTGDTSKVNEYVEAGLPNIEGYLKVASNAFATEISGAFARTTTGTCHVLNQGTVSTDNGVYFDASASNDIYGKSDTVQPNAIKQLLYICVGNTKVESAVTDVTQITTSENDTLPLFHNFYSKEDMTITGAYVNASLGEFLGGNDYKTAYAELEKRLGTGNVKSIDDEYTDYDFVVNQDNMTFRLPLLNGERVLVEKKEATTDDPTWYNLYNDGWLEQGGNVATAGTNVVLTLNFLKSFSNTDYYFNRSAIKKTADGNNATTFTGCQNKTTSSVQFYCENSAYVDSYDWCAEGYTSIPNTNTNLYYKVDNAVTNLELLDVAKVMNEAVLKSSLVEANVIVESYVNGTSGYNVYSNGYCEQWGVYQFTGTHGTQYTINLLKEMKNSDYITLRGGTFGIGTTSLISISEISKATNSFVIQYGSQTGGSYAVTYNWKACGYIK